MNTSNSVFSAIKRSPRRLALVLGLLLLVLDMIVVLRDAPRSTVSPLAPASKIAMSQQTPYCQLASCFSPSTSDQSDAAKSGAPYCQLAKCFGTIFAGDSNYCQLAACFRTPSAPETKDGGRTEKPYCQLAKCFGE